MGRGTALAAGQQAGGFVLEPADLGGICPEAMLVMLTEHGAVAVVGAGGEMGEGNGF